MSLRPFRVLQDRTVCITGASSGIGAAIATSLAAQGANIALGSRRSEKLEEVKQQILEQYPDVKIICVPTDVTVRDDVETLVAETEKQLGNIDVFVNNAGVMYYTLMKNLHVDDWMKQIDINCKGYLHSIAAILPGFLEKNAGHIVSITSDAGRRPFPGLAVYSGTKAFMESVSQSLREEIAGTNIRLTCVQPGNVDTPLQSMSNDEAAEQAYGPSSDNKMLEAKDIGDAVLFAVSQPAHVSVNEILVQPTGESF